MSSGAIVGVTFFVIFMVLAAVVTGIFVMRRQGRPLPIIGTVLIL